MKGIKNMKFYIGTKGFGWRMYGFGYKNLMFIGLSIRDDSNKHNNVP